MTLGLSYSLTNDDIFSFLSHLPELQHLHLYYYWVWLILFYSFPAKNLIWPEQQIKRPAYQPRLAALRSFTVTYKQTYTRNDTDELDKWIRRAIAGSSHLERLHLVCDQEDSSQTNVTPAVAHDALVEHIVRKHAGSIRVLSLRSAFIRIDFLRALLASCSKLEECHFRTNKAAMVSISVYRLLFEAQLRFSLLRFSLGNDCGVKGYPASSTYCFIPDIQREKGLSNGRGYCVIPLPARAPFATETASQRAFMGGQFLATYDSITILNGYFTG